MLTLVPSHMVSANFTMNPEIEDLIRGVNLQVGMVVLLEDTLSREDPDKYYDATPERKLSLYEHQRALTTARWCRIEDFYIKNDIAHFIGVYVDGTKRSRMYNTHYCWYVKTESFPKSLFTAN